VTAVWWAVDERMIMIMLHRVADGEDPDVVYAEYYVNAEREYVDEGDG